jgi:hypothetical protein
MSGHWRTLLLPDALHFHKDHHLCQKYDYLIAYLSGIKDAGFLERTLPILLDNVSLSVHQGM